MGLSRKNFSFLKRLLKSPVYVRLILTYFTDTEYKEKLQLLLSTTRFHLTKDKTIKTEIRAWHSYLNFIQKWRQTINRTETLADGITLQKTHVKQYCVYNFNMLIRPIHMEICIRVGCLFTKVQII